MLPKSVVVFIVISLLLASTIECFSRKKTKGEVIKVPANQNNELFGAFLENTSLVITSVMLVIFTGLLLYAIGFVLSVLVRMFYPN